MAFAVGIVCARLGAAGGWPVWRTALAGAAAVASHTLLDLLGAGGRSLELFWPLSSARYHSPWRLLPDAPRGLKLLSRAGLLEFATEFALFLPMTIYALWPHIAARRARAAAAELATRRRASAPAAPARRLSEFRRARSALAFERLTATFRGVHAAKKIG